MKFVFLNKLVCFFSLDHKSMFSSTSLPGRLSRTLPRISLVCPLSNLTSLLPHPNCLLINHKATRLDPALLFHLSPSLYFLILAPLSHALTCLYSPLSAMFQPLDFVISSAPLVILPHGIPDVISSTGNAPSCHYSKYWPLEFPDQRPRRLNLHYLYLNQSCSLSLSFFIDSTVAFSYLKG